MQGAARPHLQPGSRGPSPPIRASHAISSGLTLFHGASSTLPAFLGSSTTLPPWDDFHGASTTPPPRTKGRWPTSSRGDTRLLGQPAHKREEFRQTQGAH